MGLRIYGFKVWGLGGADSGSSSKQEALGTPRDFMGTGGIMKLPVFREENEKQNYCVGFTVWEFGCSLQRRYEQDNGTIICSYYLRFRFEGSSAASIMEMKLKNVLY